MKVLVWFVRAAVFFTLFAFALNNREPSKINLFFGYEWRAPMVFIVLVVFALGVAFGIVAMVPSWWRHRRSARREAQRIALPPPASPSPTQPAPTRRWPTRRAMDFDQQWLLLALPIAFALGWLARGWDARQRRRELEGSQKIYYQGLNFLLNEQHDKAIDAFIAAVQQDPDTSELHLALGNLFRKRGEYERAVRVHQHVLGRADLPKSDRERAQHGLAQDYLKAGLFDRAEAAYLALAGTSFDTESRLALLDLHERSRDWRAAVGVAEQLEKSGAGSFASRIAHYLCEIALEADAARQPEVAADALSRARDAAPADARPLVLSGEQAAARGDHAEALRFWNNLMAVRPAAFNLVAKRYAASARATGDAPGALIRLQALYEKAPTLDLLATVASLQPDDGARQVQLLAHLRDHPTLAAAQALLAAPSAPDGAATGALGAAEAAAVREAVGRAARPLHRYRCAACGFEAEHYFWQCPGCLGWDTYPPQRLEDL